MVSGFAGGPASYWLRTLPTLPRSTALLRLRCQGSTLPSHPHDSSTPYLPYPDRYCSHCPLSPGDETHAFLPVLQPHFLTLFALFFKLTLLNTSPSLTLSSRLTTFGPTLTPLPLPNESLFYSPRTLSPSSRVSVVLLGCTGYPPRPPESGSSHHADPIDPIARRPH